MGGDHAPEKIVAGACGAAAPPPCRIALVGNRTRLEALAPHHVLPPNLMLVHAEETVAMDEAPAAAMRRGVNTSMGKAVELVREGAADATFSAGNSGAFLAIATIRLRTLEGISRPAIATARPSQHGPMLLLDAGANVDRRPELLLHLRIMGWAYEQAAL